MTRCIPSTILLLTLSTAALAQTRPSAVMLRTPDVSKTEIVFRYGGDLWLVGKQGGEARRISSDEAPESFPKFSPDGSRVAYIGGYDGGSDLYVLDTGGGIPERVTHHPDQEIFCDWHPDGERLLYFSPQISGQRRAPKIFLVGTDGRQPEALTLPYGAFGTIDPSGTWLAYTPNSREFSTWKRYRGGRAQDIWLFNLKTSEARKITDHPGTDSMPMWYGSKVVFLSDRGQKQRLNLYAYDVENDSVEQLTHFDVDVKFPSIGPEDVVFENGGKLYRYELATQETVPVEVIIPGDRPALRAAAENVGDLLQYVNIGPTAKRAVVEARGEIFTVPVDEGVVRNLTGTSGFAERTPAWSPDGKWIAYFSDRSGEYELTLRRSDGKTFDGADENGERKLTSIGAGWKQNIQWSPDSEKIGFTTNDGGLHLCDVESAVLERVATNPGGDPLEFNWSHDSGWLAWSQRHSETRLSAIYLYEVGTQRTHEVTSGMFVDEGPAFDQKGDWLFFHSNRTFEPAYADLDTTWIYANGTNVMAVPLRADVDVPWAPKNEEEFDEDSEDEPDDDAESSDDSEDPDADSEADTDDEESIDPLVIEIEGFEARALVVPVKPGRIVGLTGLEDKLLYVRRPRTGAGEGKNKLMLCDLSADDEDEREKLVLEDVDMYALTGDGKKLLVRKGGKWGVIEPKPDQKLKDEIDVSDLVTTIDPRAEWRQLATDAWRIFRDYFYAEDMHGVDWNAVGTRTVAALADATSREDVQFLIGEMMAELNVGHAYNRRPPKGIPNWRPGDQVGLLGCDWDLTDGAYRIARILGGGSYDTDGRAPLSHQGARVAEGEYLLAVNGTPVDAGTNVYAAFVGTANKPTYLTVNAAPALDGNEREVLVKPLASESGLRYRDWVRRKREYVAEKSGGRLGFVHVPDTGRRGQNELMRQFLGQMHEDGLIVDERWNGGGQIPTRFIELLDRPLTNFWAIRHGEDWDWPPVGHRGPKAMLINQSSGSGGDAFPYYFKQSGLGKLIGTRTWGGLVGLSGNPGLIDGARPAVPRFAFYELDGTWGIEGHGVDPDIEVIDHPTLMVNGEDPQLDKAIEVLLQELETWPATLRQRPPTPDRSGAGLPMADH